MCILGSGLCRAVLNMYLTISVHIHILGIVKKKEDRRLPVIQFHNVSSDLRLKLKETSSTFSPRTAPEKNHNVGARVKLSKYHLLTIFHNTPARCRLLIAHDIPV